MLGPLLESLLAGLARALPGQCAICHAWPAEPVCRDCRARFSSPRPRCPRCALALEPANGQASPGCASCLEFPLDLDACVAALDYAYPWNFLLARYKFNSNPGDASLLAGLMRDTPQAPLLLARAQVLVPVPLSADRLRQRGYNQAWELARRLAPRKARTDVLLRLRDTQAQSGLNREERLLNLRHALAVPADQTHRVAGRRVLLVDDVMTTGATLHAASLALRAAGAREVTALVAARTAKSGDAERRPRPS